MLMLARKEGETILIGEDIKVTISAINGKQVRLAIAAPKEVVILREDYWTNAMSDQSKI